MSHQRQLQGPAVSPASKYGCDAEDDRGKSRRLETIWAWASLLILIMCWDAALRLDQRVSLPRIRIAHAVAEDRTVVSTAQSTKPD